MTAYKISAEEIMESLNQQSLEASPGRTGESSGKKSQAFEYVLKYSGRYTTKEGYENIVVKSNPNGELLRLKDVADVEFGNTYYDLYSKLNGKQSAAIVIKQSYGSNANEVIKNVKKRLEEIKAESFPKGMNYSLGYDVSKFLDASIEKVIHTLIEAFLLVSLVVFLFLGDWRSTLIPARVAWARRASPLWRLIAGGGRTNLDSRFCHHGRDQSQCRTDHQDQATDPNPTDQRTRDEFDHGALIGFVCGHEDSVQITEHGVLDCGTGDGLALVGVKVLGRKKFVAIKHEFRGGHTFLWAFITDQSQILHAMPEHFAHLPELE